MCIKINKVGKQEVGIWWVQKHFPRYGVPIWSLWLNIRSLPSIVAEKNVTKNEHICSICIKIRKNEHICSICIKIRKNEHICSICIKINKVVKQEVGIWRVQKRYPQYGIPIWCLWPNIRFLSSIVTEKSVTKNILDGWKDGRMDRRTEVKQ
jgi:hypothetical protein